MPTIREEMRRLASIVVQQWEVEPLIDGETAHKLARLVLEHEPKSVSIGMVAPAIWTEPMWAKTDNDREAALQWAQQLAAEVETDRSPLAGYVMRLELP